MENINKLYEFYNDADAEDVVSGRPQWFKMWGEKYADALDIDNLDSDLTPQEKQTLFIEVGKAFISALFYFKHKQQYSDEYRYYEPGNRDGRVIWNALKRDIDQSYKDYEKRVRNGAKGGRPKTEETA